MVTLEIISNNIDRTQRKVRIGANNSIFTPSKDIAGHDLWLEVGIFAVLKMNCVYGEGLSHRQETRTTPRIIDIAFNSTSLSHTVLFNCHIQSQHLSHESSRSSLVWALFEGSNFNSCPTIREIWAMSFLVNSQGLSSSKYTSSSHCCSVQGSSLTESFLMACHFFRHRLGISSEQKSSIWETTEAGVAMIESKGGWPATSSKSCEYVKSAARAKVLERHIPDSLNSTSPRGDRSDRRIEPLVLVLLVACGDFEGLAS